MSPCRSPRTRILPVLRERAGAILLAVALLALPSGQGTAGVPARPQTASPWPKRLGGPEREAATATAVDEDSHSYVLVRFVKETTVGGARFQSAGGSDFLVVALDVDANVLWAEQIGGPGDDEPYGIALSPAGDLYVTGAFAGTVDFDPGPGKAELVSAGGSDAFLLRLDRQGAFKWARRLGGAQADAGLRVAATNEAVWVTGSFQGTVELPAPPPPAAAGEKAAPPRPGRLASAGRRDAFVARFDPDGTFRWARQIGGPGEDEGKGVAAGVSGEVWVAGTFEKTPSLGPDGGTLDFTSAGKSDVFLLRLDATGRLLWSGRIGGAGADTCEGLTAAAPAGVAVIGEFSLTADLDPGPASQSLASQGGTDAFLVRLDGAGRLVWAHQFGETGADTGIAVAADRQGSVYATGLLKRRGAGRGPYDDQAWVAEYSASGQRTWSLGLQASRGLETRAIAVDPGGVVHVAGSFTGETAELREAGAAAIKAAGQSDAFVWRLAPVAAPRH